MAVAGRGKGLKEAFARFFEDPSREGLRDLLRDNLGETNEFDFKKVWPEAPKLAQHVLGLANFGGGCIFVGVDEGDDGVLDPVGLSSLKDRTDVEDGLHKYLPDALRRLVGVYDFTYAESEYPKLKGKSFQVLLVEDDPAHLPFVATRNGTDLRSNRIYTRRAAATQEASYEELQRIINRRLETGYSSRRELHLRSHLEQLRILYEQVSPFTTKGLLEDIIQRTMWATTLTKQVPNPSYPEEDYETFVASVIARKKRRIELELDIDDTPGSDQD
jgi:hypothetical protein